MTVRIPWSEQEAAILLHTLIKVLHNEIDRKTAIRITSKKLRELAIRNGIEIDDKFRNENGISFQMSKLEYAFTKGESGLAAKTGWYFKIVELYERNPRQFELLLKEADRMGSTDSELREKYFIWLSSRVSPAQLSELYMVYDEIEKYFLNHKILKGPFFQTTELEILAAVRSTIEKNKAFRSTYKRSLSKMSSAIRFYITYIKEHHDSIPTVADRRVDVLREDSSDVQLKGITIEVDSTPAERDSTDTAKRQSQQEAILFLLQDAKIQYIDQRGKGGCLWIIGGHELDTFVDHCHKFGIYFKYKADGSRSTAGQPAWWVKNYSDKKSDPEISNQIGLTEISEAECMISVDLEEVRSYAFMTPVSFSYFGEKTTVKNWRQLYLGCCRALYEDYPSVFEDLKGRAAKGYGQTDIGDNKSALFMRSPKQIGQDLYVETNLSATDLMRRLRQLVVFCNVDFENLLIEYRTGCSPTPKEVTERGSEPPKAFVVWMQTIGMARKTIEGYISAIKQCDDFALAKAYIDRSLFSVDSVSVLEETQNLLFRDKEFAEYNTKQHNRFSAAFKKYVDYRMSAGADIMNLPEATLQARVIGSANQNSYTVSKKVADNYSAILRDDFPDGLRQNIIHVKKFIQKYEDRFGAIEASRDEILDQLREVGVVRDERIYPRQDIDQRSLIDEIYAEIADTFQKGASCIYLSMILLRYGQQLGEQLSVYNEDALQAFLLERKPGEYFIRYGYLCNTTDQVDAANDVLHFMQICHIPVTYNEIQATLWYIPMEKIKQALIETPSLVNVDQETYYYAPNLPISADELQILIRVMQDEIGLRGFLVGRHLKELLNRHCPSAAIDTAFMKDWGIRNALSYVLCEYFEFTGALVTRKGQKFSMAEAYQDFCKNRERVTLSQLKDFSEDVGVPIYWDDVLSVTVRISPNEMIPADSVHFDVEATDAVLDKFCTGDYIPIQEIGLFLQFPPIEVPWNGFVLECYLKNSSKQFRLDQVSIAENGFYGVVVRRNSNLQNYEQVVVDMLARSNGWIDEKSALDLLIFHGYQARRRWTNFRTVVKKALLLREEIENTKK